MFLEILVWAALLLVGLMAWTAVATLVGVIFGEAVKNAKELRQRKEAP
jgi:hypothetical protein